MMKESSESIEIPLEETESYGSETDLASDDKREKAGDRAGHSDKKVNPAFLGLCRCRTCFFLLVAVCVILTGVIIALVVLLVLDEDTPQSMAMCGNCHCVISNSSNASCPEPPVEYSEDFLSALAAQRPSNTMPTVPCDPFFDSECDREDMTELSIHHRDDVVCGIHYNDANCSTYDLKTYPNRSTAEAAGTFVTHWGACGVCSTTQDLATYMRYPDLATYGQDCGTKGITDAEKGVQCFEGLGFSTPCAEIWVGNARHTALNCGGICLFQDITDTPYNGPAPDCELNACLQCEEDKSRPIFKKFAGRTRRSSGLFSAIARPCDSIANIRHQLCPRTQPLSE